VRPFLLVLTVVFKPDVRSMVKTVVDQTGHRMVESGGYGQALLLLNNGLNPDLILLEHNTDPSHAAQLVPLLKAVAQTKVCLLVGLGDQAVRATATELGIQYILPKPVTRGELESVFDGLTGSVAFESEEVKLSAIAAGRRELGGGEPTTLHLEELGNNQFLLAACPKMLEIQRQIRLLAAADVNVLILGESGTGKELVAQAIHKHSRRAGRPLHKVNCAALPEPLLESELFGHRRGAFTGATRDREGKFQQANRSTLLLDEIGEISAPTQAKFLQVLHDGEFSPLGGEQTIRVDVRVLAATNIQVESALRERTFREDLYHRLSVFTIKVPPLRERRSEIPYLIDEIIRRMPGEMKNGFACGFPSRLMDAALAYQWAGNVRELRNFVMRTIVMRDLDTATADLEAKIAEDRKARQGPMLVQEILESSDLKSHVRDLTERTEARMIERALDASGWNRRRAAQHLNISYRGLLYKIQQHQLTRGRSGRIVSQDRVG